MKLFEKIFGTYSQRQLKKLKADVDKIESLADEFKAMSDDELRAVTPKLKERYKNGETLDQLLPEAFAAVREAGERVLGKRHFRVQLIGGIVLHQGRIAEMKTGEGKTLTAALPAYLNALTGEGVHIVTVNEYLARCGAEEMGRIYNFLGLTCGLVIHDQSKADKREAYNCDITYGTNNEFGFDYLRDNMVNYKEHMVQRGHVFCIVDEVDSILIDEARTPLIISGEGSEPTEIYDKADKFVRTLREHRIKELDDKEENDSYDADYIVDEKARTTVMTASGIKKAEEFFGIENLSDAENSTLAHHIQQAVRAHGIMHLDVDYVVKDGKVVIVDSFTGRLMPGRRFSDGLHQAIEAKEKVKVEKENKTLATITFQNFFRLYKKLSGMTGTALTEEMEFREIYNLDVVEIPTNMPMIRIDHPDAVYKTAKGKYNAIIEQIKACKAKDQPVLVGTVSIDKSELLSKMLKMNGIEHTVLNAKHHEREAEIVALAGRPGTVTIATNMAGRGTDIMLGGNPEFMAKQQMKKDGYEDEIIGLAVGTAVTEDEEILAARKVYRELYDKYKEEIAEPAKKVCEAGGLFIIGTERHESRRIDNQLRGRSGRQGDPGESRFFLSFEDDLMRLFGSERILGIVEKLGLEEDQPIEANILSNSIENAQKQLEDQNFSRRKNVLTYDDVMNQQRAVIYKQRMDVLNGENLRDKIIDMIHRSIENTVATATAEENHHDWNFEAIRSEYRGLLCGDEDFVYSDEELEKLKAQDITDMLIERADKLYEAKEKLFAENEIDMREVERTVLLRCVDSEWMNHIDAMDDLKGSIGLHAYAQRNPVTEYRIQGADMFDEMITAIRNRTVNLMLRVMPKQKEAVQRVPVAKVFGEGFEGQPGGQRLTPQQLQAFMAARAKAIQQAQAQKAAQAQQNGEAKPAADSLRRSQPMPGTASTQKMPKVGRNDPCPCGSGKKYKKCCGAAANDSSDDE